MSRCKLSSTFVALGLLTLVCTATAAPPQARASKHCVVKLQPAESGTTKLVSGTPECYPTFRDAILFATGGTILIPEGQPLGSQLDLLEQEQKAAKDQLAKRSTFVIAIDYEHTGYGGDSLIWQYSSPCTPAGGYVASSMPSGWNDKLSSTRGYSDCSKNILFEHPSWTGTRLTCRPDCSSVGSMNDKTSSREWRHLCEGVAGQWQGCRGTGCSVCAELVANYPCYFQNHPNCTSNSLCGGQYFTCSDACPAPTQADTCNNTCNVTATCANAGGGSVSCSSNNGDCFAVDNCYVVCDGIFSYCPNPQGICPL
jgi:hypothetical protein